MIDKKFEEGGKLVQEGLEAESRTDVDAAIAAYERAINLDFEGNHPYDRLAILYRKRKQVSEEVRVLQKAIEVFTWLSKTSPRQDVKPKLEKFKRRVEKAHRLQEESMS